MQLEEVMQGIDYKVLAGHLNQDIKGISYDSRKVKEGDLFICIPGLKADGHDFVEQAINQGATALLVEKEVLLHPAITVLQTTECRRVMAIVASNFFRQPSHDIKTIGVTGTNGKTTTTHLIKAILEEQGNGVGILGTLYARMGDNERVLGNRLRLAN